jgi:hypothetical protein
MNTGLRMFATGAALVATGAAAIGCCKAPSAWSIDRGYSSALLAIGQNYTVKTGQDAAMTVDAIQLFGPSDPNAHYETVEEIRALGFMFESTDRDMILRLFASIRDRIGEPDCGKGPKEVSLYILAYDRDLMRVGVLKYYDCEGGAFGAVTAYGSGSAIFSSSVRKFLAPFRLK